MSPHSCQSSVLRNQKGHFPFKVLSHANLQLFFWEPSEEMVNQLISDNLKKQEIGKQSIWLDGKVVP